MGTTTGKGLPFPFGTDGNNVPVDTLALATRIDDVFSPRTYAQIAAFSGVELWDGRLITQSDTGTDRPWAGMYSYKASAGIWQSLVPRASTSWDTDLQFAGSGSPTWGTGSIRVGRYARFGSQILGQFVIYTGSPGFSTPGSQVASIALPPDAPYKELTPVTQIGNCALFDSTGADWSRSDICGGSQSSTARADFQQAHSGSAGGNPLANIDSSGWVSGMTLFGLVFYESTEET